MDSDDLLLVVQKPKTKPKASKCISKKPKASWKKAADDIDDDDNGESHLSNSEQLLMHIIDRDPPCLWHQYSNQQHCEWHVYSWNRKVINAVAWIGRTPICNIQCTSVKSSHSIPAQHQAKRCFTCQSYISTTIGHVTQFYKATARQFEEGDCQCYNTVRTPTLCIHDTLDMLFFFLPTLFVAHLMLDSYRQLHSLIRYHSTSPMPRSLFYLWRCLYL